MSQDITNVPKVVFRVAMDLKTTEKTVVIPGSLEVKGNLIAPDTNLTVYGNLTVTGIINCPGLHVTGVISHSIPSNEGAEET